MCHFYVTKHCAKMVLVQGAAKSQFQVNNNQRSFKESYCRPKISYTVSRATMAQRLVFTVASTEIHTYLAKNYSQASHFHKCLKYVLCLGFFHSRNEIIHLTWNRRAQMRLLLSVWSHINVNSAVQSHVPEASDITQPKVCLHQQSIQEFWLNPVVMLCQLSLRWFSVSTFKSQASALLSYTSAVESMNTSAHQISFGFAALPQFLAGRCSSNCAHLKVFLSHSQAHAAAGCPLPPHAATGKPGLLPSPHCYQSQGPRSL